MMLQLLYLYLGISFTLAIIVAIGVIASPRGARLELATWGAVGAFFWWLLIAALVAEQILAGAARLSNRLNGR